MISYRFSLNLILLLISLVLTSGAHSTVTALLQDGTSSVCCDIDTASPATPLEVPCSAPDCQCIACLSFVVPARSPQPALNGFPTASSFNYADKTPPPEYVKTIDYPPEFS